MSAKGLPTASNNSSSRCASAYSRSAPYTAPYATGAIASALHAATRALTVSIDKRRPMPSRKLSSGGRKA